MQTQMTRSTTDKVIGGVCGGLGQYFNVDPVFVRLGFVFMTLATGLGVLLYAALWLVLPSSGGRAIFDQAMNSVQQVGQQVSQSMNAQPRFDSQTGLPLAQPRNEPGRNQKLGVVLVGIGILMLASFLNIAGPAVAFMILGTGWYLLRKS